MITTDIGFGDGVERVGWNTEKVQPLFSQIRRFWPFEQPNFLGFRALANETGNTGAQKVSYP